MKLSAMRGGNARADPTFPKCWEGMLAKNMENIFIQRCLRTFNTYTWNDDE